MSIRRCSLAWCVIFICSLSIESAIDIMPINTAPIPYDIAYSKEPQINTGLNIVDHAVNARLPAPNLKGESINPLQRWILLGGVIWVIGIMAMLIYSMIQYMRLKRRLIGSTPLRDNIYLADHISAPFVMGFIKPVIYLPSSMTESEPEFILLHEQCHIKRLDHITRIIAFTALTIHWFNPLVWLAFILSGKDMEMSCDEAVMKKMDTDVRVEYSRSLLRFATGKKLIAAIPLAFGEGNTKDRVKNVMRYKKPMFWVSLAAVITVICVAVGLMSSPKSKPNETDAVSIENIQNYSTEYESSAKSSTKYKTEAEFLNHPDGVKFQTAAYRAAKAYLSGDLDELSKYITENCTVDTKLDLYKNIDYIILKWSLNDIKADNKIDASYEFLLKGEDSVSYVTMELIKVDDEWKADSIALEK